MTNAKPDPRIMFAGVTEAKVRVPANYIRPGHIIAKIRRVERGITRAAKKPFIVFEMTVLKHLGGESGQGHRIGEDFGHMIVENDSFASNVKGALMGILGVSESEISAQDAIEICAEDQPLANTIVEVKSHTILTKAGEDFTVVNYLGEVPASRALLTIDPQVLEANFADGYLQALAANEAAAAEPDQEGNA